MADDIDDAIVLAALAEKSGGDWHFVAMAMLEAMRAMHLLIEQQHRRIEALERMMQ